MCLGLLFSLENYLGLVKYISHVVPYFLTMLWDTFLITWYSSNTHNTHILTS